MGMDFNVKPANAPGPAVYAPPAGESVRDAVTTQLPASQTITAADISTRVRNDARNSAAGTSHQTVFDRDAAAMVYQVVDNRTSIVVRQFPDDAMLRRRAYFHAMDMLKSDAPRDRAADRTA
ncbi:MAG: hypothetical protein WBA29_03580 [Xanthobacteraceae bacterium]